MDNPFDDLIPQNSASPFSDLVPENIKSARQENLKKMSDVVGASSSPWRTIKNIAAGLGEAGQNIGDLMVKGIGMKPGAHLDIANTFGAGNSARDKFEQGIGQYGIPSLALGGVAAPLGRAGAMLENSGRLGKFAANVMSRGAPQAAFMSTQTQNPLTGLAAGFGGQAVGETLPYVIPAAKSLFGAGKNIVNTIKDAAGSVKNVFQTAKKPFQDLPEAPTLPSPPEFPKLNLPEAKQLPASPEFQAEAPKTGNDLLQHLGKGASNKEESSTALASIIREKYNQRLDETKPFFEYPMKTAGSDRLYEHIDPLITTALDKEMNMMNRLDGLNVGALYDKFKNNPSIENAHYLKSELGSVVGDLEKNTDKTVGDRNTIASINSVRKRLDEDIVDAFKRHDAKSNDNLTPMYQTGVQLHKTNVEPYRSSPALREITVKGIETPKNIESIFDTPSNIVKKGVSQTGAINKVMQDLPDEAKDLILFNKIGAQKYSENPQKLLDALDAAKNEGYASYFNPKNNQGIETLRAKLASDIENKEAAKVTQVNAAKEQDRAYKKSVDEAKAEHKRQTQELKESYKTAKTNAILEHRAKVAQIKQANNMIKDARTTRNWTLGGLGAVGAGMGGFYNFKDKVLP